MIHTHARTHTHTIDWTALDEGSARRRDLLQITHNTYKRETSVPPAGFEPVVPTSELPQAYELDRAATWIDRLLVSIPVRIINRLLHYIVY